MGALATEIDGSVMVKNTISLLWKDKNKTKHSL